MARIILALCLLISSVVSAQPGYTNINSRYKWIAGGFDSSLILPRYNGVPSGLRSAWNTDGQLAVDTANNRLYVYSGGAWVRVANYSDVGSTYTFPYSIVAPGNAIQLENDTTANPANYFYGRNSVGRRGWYPQSSITGVNIYNTNGTLTGHRFVNKDGYNLFITGDGVFSANTEAGDSTNEVGTSSSGAYINSSDNNIVGFSSTIYAMKSGITIEPHQGNLKIDSLNYTLSTTGKKIMLRDTATGLLENIDPALIGGGGSSPLFPLTGTGTATGNVTGSLATNQLNITNNRGYLKFRNADSAMLHIKGSGSLPLFQLDSNGAVRFKVYAGGQIAAGDSAANLFIGQNSGLNIQPGDINTPPGNWNYSLGTNTLQELTVGNDNVAIGSNSMRYSLSSFHSINIGTGTSGNATHIEDVVAIGTDNLIAVDSSSRLTAIGSYSQFKATRTIGNTSLGFASIYGGTTGPWTGSYNTASGYQSANNITTSSSNTASGYAALFSQTTGNSWGGNNTAVGSLSGYSTNNDYGLFLGNSAGFYSNEANAFYLHTLTSGITDEATGKSQSMFYGKFAPSGANLLRMNGRFGINTMPDSNFHVVGNSFLDGKLRIKDGTQVNGYVLTSDANGNASWQAGSGGGGGSPAGNYGNLQLNRNSAFATPASDSLTYTTSGGLVVLNNATVGNVNSTATLNIAAKDGEGKLAFKYATTDYGYFKVNTASGQVSLGSDQYPVTINSGSTVTINNDLALNTTSLGLGRKMSLRYTGVEYGYMAIETNNSEFRSVSPNTYDFTWTDGSSELMRLKNSNGSLGIGATPAASAKLTVTSTTQGFLPPRMTGTQAEAISSPAEGLMIYSTNGSGSVITSKGWWGYDGSAWVKLN